MDSRLKPATPIQKGSTRLAGRRGKADKVRFLNTSEASLEESRYYLILSEDLGYGKTGKLPDSLEEVSRMLNSYSKTILDSYSGS